MMRIKSKVGLRLLAGGLLWLLALGALAAQTKIGDLCYSLNNGNKTATVTMGRDDAGNYIQYAGDIVIPESVDYNGTAYAVTSIDYGAFAGCTGLTSIEIPSSVTEIGSSAFAGCTGLASIEIPSSVTYIGDETFAYCTGLTEVTIPASVTTIGKGAFYNCTGLTSVTIPNSVTEIGSSAFFGCTGLVTINVDESNTKYSSVDGVLYDKAKTSLLQCPGGKTSVEIPNSVTSIGSSAFYGCTGLTSVTIPNSVTSIGSSAFAGCTGLASIEIPGSVTSIGDGTFENCTGLTSIEIPSSVTYIGDETFAYCTGLTEVAIADRETGLCFRSNVFESCPIRRLYLGGDISYSGSYSPFLGLTTLETLTIGGSVTEIDGYVFSGCTGLTSIYVDESNDAYCVVDDVLYNKDKTCLLICSRGKTEFSMPNSVTSIGGFAFSGCTGLTSMEIPTSVDTVGYCAFLGCTGLTEFTIADRETTLYFIWGSPFGDVGMLCPVRTLYLGGNIEMLESSRSPFYGMTTLETLTISTSVTEIGYSAFYGCRGLASIEIPNSVTEIGDYAFKNCGGLLSLTFGKSVSQIGRGIVDDCDKLRRLICTSEEPAACHTNAFQDIHKIRCDLLVPETALEAYKNALVWGDFLRIAGGDGSDKVYVERLSLTSPVTPAKLKVGEGMLLSAVITPTNATNQTLNWSSSDKNVLRVDYDGYVIAVGAGEAVVTARTTDGSNLSATCTVTVTAAGSGDDGDDDKILVETLEISTGGASTELQAGGTLQLSAVITPSNATNKAVTWSSSDKKVATVDNDGYVMAVAIGEAVITARTTDGSDLSATCSLTVTAAGSGGGNTAVEVPDALKAVRVYAADGHIELRGLPLGTAVALSGVDGRLYYQTEAVTGPELTLSAPRGHVYVLRLNHTHSLKVYLP